MFSKELNLDVVKDYYNGLGKLNNLKLNISQKIQRHIMNIHSDQGFQYQNGRYINI